MTQITDPNLSNSNNKLAAKLYDELQTTFIRNVEHELRTPVTIIQGYAHLLSEGTLGNLAPEQEEAIFAITNRSEELRTLVERITTLLAVKAKAVPPRPFSLLEVANQVVELYQPQAEEADLDIVLNLPDDLPPALGFARHIQQAMDCLVDNAIKFTPPGNRVEISVDTTAEHLRLTVADTGIGIPSEQLEKIFQSFYQIDGSTTRRYDGLGLGLAVVKAVAEAYGGQIEVKSRPGAGSQFTLKLLLDHSQTTGIKEKTMQQLQPQPRNILVVDDEEYVALTLQAGLEKLSNCQIYTATSGRQALEICQERSIDLLFTDYRMPDIDGLSLASQVQALYPHIVVIMITAHSNKELYQQAHGLPIDRILNKPVGFKEVREAAQEVLANSNPSTTNGNPSNGKQ